MKLIVLVGLFSFSAFALPPMVFMRETSLGKQIVLKKNNQEIQITNDANIHLYPDISPNGQWITWVEGATERNLNVALYNVQTRSKERFVTSSKGKALQPRFSKDGRKIFFSAPSRSGNKISFIVPTELRASTTPRSESGINIYNVQPETVPHDGQGFFPRPSTDGSFVIFQRNKFLKKEIVEYNFKTKVTRVLASGMAPAMSLNENLIAYTSKEAGSWDIWLVDRHSNNRSQHTNDPKDEMAPTFMLDGTLSFSSNRSGNFQIYNVKAGEWNQIVTSNDDDNAPNFAGESEWQQTLLAPMLPPLRSSFGAIELNGQVYVCGGHAGSEHSYPPESFVANMQVYNPATNKWKELAPRPHKAHGFSLAAFGQYIYAFGGFAYEANNEPKWKSLDVIDRYDTVTDQWITIGKLPRARSSNVIATVGSKAYLVGGWDSTPSSPGDFEGNFHSIVDVFDLQTESVSEAQWQLPTPLRRAFSAVVYQEQIYLVGGLGVGSSHFELLANVTQINPVTGFATEITMLPFSTLAPAAGMVGNELMVFGGMFKTSPTDYEYASHIYSHEINGFRWNHTGRFVTETKGFSQVVSLKNGLLILGGHHQYGDRDEAVDTVEFLTK